MPPRPPGPPGRPPPPPGRPAKPPPPPGAPPPPGRAAKPPPAPGRPGRHHEPGAHRGDRPLRDRASCPGSDADRRDGDHRHRREPDGHPAGGAFPGWEQRGCCPAERPGCFATLVGLAAFAATSRHALARRERVVARPRRSGARRGGSGFAATLACGRRNRGRSGRGSGSRTRSGALGVGAPARDGASGALTTAAAGASTEGATGATGAPRAASSSVGLDCRLLGGRLFSRCPWHPRQERRRRRALWGTSRVSCGRPAARWSRMPTGRTRRVLSNG